VGLYSGMAAVPRLAWCAGALVLGVLAGPACDGIGPRLQGARWLEHGGVDGGSSGDVATPKVSPGDDADDVGVGDGATAAEGTSAGDGGSGGDVTAPADGSGDAVSNEGVTSESGGSARGDVPDDDGAAANDGGLGNDAAPRDDGAPADDSGPSFVCGDGMCAHDQLCLVEFYGTGEPPYPRTTFTCVPASCTSCDQCYAVPPPPCAYEDDGFEPVVQCTGSADQGITFACMWP
jgi:hypothetical protein